MGEVLSFPGGNSCQRRAGSWTLITIERSQGRAGWFDLCAWTGSPSEEGVDRMFIGACPSLLDAAELARVKKRDLGAWEIADLSALPTDPDSPEAA